MRPLVFILGIYDTLLHLRGGLADELPQQRWNDNQCPFNGGAHRFGCCSCYLSCRPWLYGSQDDYSLPARALFEHCCDGGRLYLEYSYSPENSGPPAGTGGCLPEFCWW